jgi:amino acid permease
MGLTAVTKSQVLLGIASFVLFPLCLMERIGSLAFFSMIGSVGTFVTIFTMVRRYFDGSYLVGGKYYGDLPEDCVPSFGNDGAIAFFSRQSLVLISILSQGFIAHYNSPRYYFELKDHTIGRFNVVVNFSFLFAAVTYVVVSSLGFLTFGENSNGFILDNYSYKDPLATIARCGVAFSVIFAYPLLFHGGRDSSLAILGWHDASVWQLRFITVIMLSIVTALSIYVNDLTFVLSFSGATMSTLLIYIFPSIMFRALVKNCACLHSDRTNWEVKQSLAMICFGGVVGILGAIVTVARTFY